jgi:hypothetical protein
MTTKPPRAKTKVAGILIPVTSLTADQMARLAVTTPPPAIEPSPKPKKARKARAT